MAVTAISNDGGESERQPEQPVVTELDRYLALPMFVVAVMFLVIAGFLLPTLIYRESSALEGNSEHPVKLTNDLFRSQSDAGLPEEIIYFVPEVRLILNWALIFLYALLVLEWIVHLCSGGKNLRQHWSYLLAPFLRLSARDHIDGSHVWVIGLGWTKSTLLLEKKLAGAFGIPMMALALPVLPLVIIQLFWSSTVNSDPHLKFLMATATAVIWMAFVFEFAIMFTVARRKIKYCKEHWLNLLIVVLPLFGFLRLAALGNVFKLKQLAKTASVLRLRGLAIRLWRAVTSLGIIDTALRKTPDHKIEKLERMIEEKKEELELLQWERARAIEVKEEKRRKNPPPRSADSEKGKSDA